MTNRMLIAVSLALLVGGVAAVGSAGFGASRVEAAAAPDRYQVDPVHSSCYFGIRHANAANFYGRFNSISGAFVLDESDPSASSFEVEIDAASIDTANDDRDRHLRSADFFSVTQFPLIRFKSDRVSRGDADNLYEATGDLTLHGVTRQVTIPVEHTATGEFRGQRRAGVEARFTIKRSDYGMDYMLGMLGDEISLIVSLEGMPEK